MIHDARMEVTCDHLECEDFISISPPYVYTDFNGDNGYYDTGDSTLNELIEKEGWLVKWTVNSYRHYCEDCKEQFEED
jgi:hypothetical protein